MGPAIRAGEVTIRWPEAGTSGKTKAHHSSQYSGEVHSAVKFTKGSWRAKPLGPLVHTQNCTITDFCRGRFQGDTCGALMLTVLEAGKLH